MIIHKDATEAARVALTRLMKPMPDVGERGRDVWLVALGQVQASLDFRLKAEEAEQAKEAAFLADAEAIAKDGLPVSQFDVRPIEVRFYDWCADSAVGFSRWSYNTIKAIAIGVYNAIKALAVWVYNGLALFAEFIGNAILIPIGDMLIDLFIWVEKGLGKAWSRIKDFYRMHRG